MVGFFLLKGVSVCPNDSNLYCIVCNNKFKGDLLRLIITVSIVKIIKRKVIIALEKIVNVIKSM
ncbi:hypothetical protein DJ86_2646 [Bacillus cereus ATCC 4342]|nr:hypothetical protein BF35_455 [Bacillus cereus ATCC 4342]KFM88842.1 hypothetical protein DJ86_2646 [Bacillus cereus ATCC 4342]GCF69431.1 hypothetical protein BC2903_32500 [Bacillus cereus]